MKYDNIDKAKYYKSEIETLEIEIQEIEKLVSAKKLNPKWLFANKIKEKPKEKTYKGFYCTNSIDSIGSIVLINAREAQAVINIKKIEIEEFKKKIAELN